MLTAVEGIYKNGRIELLEKSEKLAEGKVLVVFLEQPTIVEAIPLVENEQEEPDRNWLGRV